MDRPGRKVEERKPKGAFVAEALVLRVDLCCSGAGTNHKILCHLRDIPPVNHYKWREAEQDFPNV